jgi:hypothetical protein
MAILGFILNFLGGALLIYYGDKTGIGADRAAKDFLLSRWVFYAGVVCFSVGFILILVSMIFRG